MKQVLTKLLFTVAGFAVVCGLLCYSLGASAATLKQHPTHHSMLHTTKMHAHKHVSHSKHNHKVHH